MEGWKSLDPPLEGDSHSQPDSSDTEEVHHSQEGEGHLREHDYADSSSDYLTDPNPTNTMVVDGPTDPNTSGVRSCPLVVEITERTGGDLAPDHSRTENPEEYGGYTLVAKLRFPRAGRELIIPVQDEDMYTIVSVSLSNPKLGKDSEGAEALWDHFRRRLGKPDSYRFTLNPSGAVDWSSTKMSEVLREKLEQVRDSITQDHRPDPLPVPESTSYNEHCVHDRAEEVGIGQGTETGERLSSQPLPNQATPQGGIASDKESAPAPKSVNPKGGASH